ncbi:MAG: hypothetical protein JSU94_16200, partial [Phycisphaerales bacterium]
MKSDIGTVSAELYFIEVVTRVPLKFGPETLTSVSCARVCVTVEDGQGRRAQGWGETPLSVQWAWPGSLSYQERHEAMRLFCRMLAEAWAGFEGRGHPIELGAEFIESVLPEVLGRLNRDRGEAEAMPWLAALVCCSAFDVAVHDAYGVLLGREVYSTYSGEFMNSDLSRFLEPAEGFDFSFAGKYPADFLESPAAQELAAWHLVGGKDPLDEPELTGDEPDDGYPVLLADWIRRDGLTCLKVKLRGNDSAWDYARLVRVGEIAIENGVTWLTSDFNCTVTEVGYVNEILD